jgi:hypothetical protein
MHNVVWGEVRAVETSATTERAAFPATARALWLLLVTGAMSTGAALIVTVFTRVSLALTLLCAAMYIVCIVSLIWARLPSTSRAPLVRRVRTGFLAGLLATPAYDLTRLAIVDLVGLSVWPFDTFPLFGRAILGPGWPASVTLLAGVAYHYLNGMCFATAYSITFWRRYFLFGVIFAVGLELAMLTVYPRWLPLSSVLGEFTIVSATGHIAYGLAIGLVTQYGPRIAERVL